MIRLCRRCGLQIASRAYRLPKELFAVSVVPLGISAGEVLTLADDQPHTLIPVDTQAEGEQCLPLYANGRHVVGDLTIKVVDGSITIAVSLYDERTELLSCDIRVFNSLSDITPAKLMRGKKGYELAETITPVFKPGQDKVIWLSVYCLGVYDIYSEKNPHVDAGGPDGKGILYETLLEQMRMHLPDAQAGD